MLIYLNKMKYNYYFFWRKCLLVSIGVAAGNARAVVQFGGFRGPVEAIVSIADGRVSAIP